MHVREKTHPLNCSLSEPDVTSQTPLKEAEDECSLQAAGRSQKEGTL